MSSDRPGAGAGVRLPPSWQVALGGVVAQVAVVAALLAGAVVSGDRIGSLAGWYLLALALLAGVVAAVPVALLRAGRHRRVAVALATLVGVGVLVVTEFAFVTLVLPLSLFLAAGLGWRERRSADAAVG